MQFFDGGGGAREDRVEGEGLIKEGGKTAKEV